MAITLGGESLSPAWVWVNRYADPGMITATAEGLDGGLIYQQQARPESGRRMELRVLNTWNGWITETEAQALAALRDGGGEMALDYHGYAATVIIARFAAELVHPAARNRNENERVYTAGLDLMRI